MNFQERVWSTSKSLLRICYTLLMRNRFAYWGARSRLGLPAKLIAPNLIFVESNVHICEHAWLNGIDDRGDGKPTLKIGQGTYIGRFAHINACREVIIGQNVLISDRVYISDADHNHLDTEMPIILQGVSFKGAVRLMDGCWVGIGAVILPGVTIGKNAIIGANAVVTKSVPDYAVAGGIPAKVLNIIK